MGELFVKGPHNKAGIQVLKGPTLRWHVGAIHTHALDNVEAAKCSERGGGVRGGRVRWCGEHGDPHRTCRHARKVMVSSSWNRGLAWGTRSCFVDKAWMVTL